jgi:ABC-type lipoprotein release transport system permease subunit
MQILLNILLYAFLAYWLYDSIVHKDYWYAFVVLFVIAVSVVVTLLPGYHASKVSPGEYPYDE